MSGANPQKKFTTEAIEFAETESLCYPTGGSYSDIRSSRMTLPESPTFLPIAFKISAFIGSLCVPLPSAMKELRNSWPSTVPRTFTKPRVSKNSTDWGQTTKVQPPFFGLFWIFAVNDFFMVLTRKRVGSDPSVDRDLRALGGR